MNRLKKRIASAWRRHGFSGVVRLGFKNMAYQLSRVGGNVREETGTQSFDAIYSTETSAICEIGSLDITSPNERHAVRYQPSPDRIVRSAIADLNIDPAAFTFIDFGSGKGRVLMVAAEYPFKQVVGVEFSSELNEIAKRNIARLPPNLNSADRITILCCDAIAFAPPPGNLVCYFYNPFGAAVLGPIAARLGARAGGGDRTIIIYVDPRHRECFERFGRFKVLHSEPALLVFGT